MSGDVIMELQGGEGKTLCSEDEYIGFEIPPVEELQEIESTIVDALKSGADLLPAVFLLENCRSLAEAGRMDEYTEVCSILSGLCRDMPVERGGKLKPVGDYLGFYPD